MKFGVREICDVVFKAKKSGSLGNYNYSVGQPVLYIDSAKTSTIEGAASTVYATGGRGNSRLIAWEGEKTLTFTVEDALLSEKGLAILTGAGLFNLSKTYEHKLKITNGIITVSNDGNRISFDAQTIYFKSNRNIQYTDLYELLKNEYLLCNYSDAPEKIFRKDCLVLKGTNGEELWLAADHSNEVAIGRIWSTEQPVNSFTTLRDFSEVDQRSLQDVFEQGDFPLYTITINNPVRVHHIEKTVMHLAIEEDEVNSVLGAYINLPAGKGAISTTSPCFVVQTDENGSFIRAFKGLKVIESIRMQDEELAVIAPTEELSSVVKYFEPGEYKVPVFVDYYTEEKPSVTQFIIDAQNFAGYYYVEATTDFRRAADGKDLKAMITFPNVKVQSNFTFNMAATGDPSTFSFVMDAMPGYTLNRPNKKVLCEMEIVDDVSADEAIENNDSILNDVKPGDSLFGTFLYAPIGEDSSDFDTNSKVAFEITGHEESSASYEVIGTIEIGTGLQPTFIPRYESIDDKTTIVLDASNWGEYITISDDGNEIQIKEFHNVAYVAKGNGYYEIDKDSTIASVKSTFTKDGKSYGLKVKI